MREVNQQDYIKFVAIICMVIDHAGLYFFSDHLYMRAIGRIAFPVFCYYAGYNFKSFPSWRILLHGVILYLFSIIFVSTKNSAANILISIFLGQCYLYFFKRWLHHKYRYFHYIVLLYGFVFTYPYFQYGSLAILIMLIGYLKKEGKVDFLFEGVFLCLISFSHSYVTFNGYFGFLDYFIVVVSLFLLFILLKEKRGYALPEWRLISFVSRNSLVIYSVHIMIIRVIWEYYVNLIHYN